MSCRPIRVFYGNGFTGPNGVNTMSNLLISRLDPHRTFAVKRVEADISVLKQYLLDVVPSYQQRVSMRPSAILEVVDAPVKTVQVMNIKRSFTTQIRRTLVVG